MTCVRPGGTKSKTTLWSIVFDLVPRLGHRANHSRSPDQDYSGGRGAEAEITDNNTETSDPW